MREYSRRLNAGIVELRLDREASISRRMNTDRDSTELAPKLKLGVARLCSLVVIASTAVGFYGSVLLSQGLVWIFMVIMVVGNVASIYVSAKFGYEKSDARENRVSRLPSIMVTSETDVATNVNSPSAAGVATESGIHSDPCSPPTGEGTPKAQRPEPLETHM